MKHLLSHLIHRHILPILLLPIVVSGIFCVCIFELPAMFRSPSTPDRVISVVFSSLGILGTIATYLVFRVVRRRDQTWRVFELGRTAWTVLISVAWLCGVACGILIFYESLR